jgi:hypothetical protein
MSLKENLKKKILIDSLAKAVSRSIGPSGGPRKIDKENMRKLLSFTPFVLEKRRDLELYFRELEPGWGRCLALITNFLFTARPALRMWPSVGAQN